MTTAGLIASCPMHRRQAWLAAVALAPLLACAARAQDAASPATGEIVVTATRRAATVNSVPLSIQALSAKSLAEQGSYDFNSYARSVTGLSALDRGPGQQLITFRGVSSDTSATNTDAPEAKETTAIYFDETPISLSGFNPDLQLVDIERIEVLKGPQGTLFGAGALAGVIRIIGRKPDLSTFGGSAELEFSQFDRGGQNYAANATINLPIVTDKIAFRLTGYGRRDGGFIDNVGLEGDRAAGRVQKNVNSDQIEGVRAQLRVEPSDRFGVTFKVVRQSTKLDGTQNVDVDVTRGGTPDPDIPAGVVLNGKQQFRRGAEPYRDGITILNADAKLRLGAFDVVSSTSYVARQQNADIDFSGVTPGLFGVGPLSHPGLLFNHTRVKSFVQEVRLVSSRKTSAFQWIVGGFYDGDRKIFQQDLVSVGINADNGGAFGSDNLLHTVAHFADAQFAFFGEASYRLGKFTATTGLRYFNFRSVYTLDGDGAALGGPLSLAGRVTKGNGVNPKFNIAYKADADRLFYVQAVRGFRLGGINDPLLAICSATDAASYVDSVKSDHLWNYEAGAKLGWLGGKLQTNIAAYRIDWSSVPITRQLACGVSNTVTAGSLRVTGIEFDASARVGQYLRLAGGFSYADSKIHSIDPLVGAATGIVAGEQAAGISPWNANLTSTLEAPIGQGAKAYADLTYQYVGSIYNYPGTFDPRRVEQAPYSTVNLRLGARRDRWDVSLFVNNLLNERAVLFHDRILGTTRDTINRPRAIGINARTDF